MDVDDLFDENGQWRDEKVIAMPELEKPVIWIAGISNMMTIWKFRLIMLLP